VNESFSRAFKMGEVQGQSIFEIDHGVWDFPQLRHLLERIIPDQQFFEDFEITRDFGRIGRRSLLLNARVLNESDAKPREILLGIRDITEGKRVANELAEARASLAKHAGKLETLVARRTAQLLTTNRQLEASLASIKQGQNEYRTLFRESEAMQKKLRQLTHQVIATQEAERKRISRELHDEVVQALVGINVELTAICEEAAASAPDLREKIVHTQRIVTDTVHAVHRFARGLRPAVLDDLGLIAALHAQCRSLAAKYKIVIKLTAARSVDTLGSAERTVLFRVAQEALNNIVRHAHASHVRINLTRVAGAVCMEIADNGKAFDVEATLRKGSNKRLGLVGMRERVEMVGGSLTVESEPGTGTTVRADVPLRIQKREAERVQGNAP
jgi:two-component system, NarL family, sensor histidine kinase DegS